MAFFNEIGAGRFNRALQKLLNMKGGPPSRSLSSDIIPVMAFEPFDAVELRVLQGWDRFSSATVQAAVAAQVGMIQIRNPLLSNVLAVIEKITIAESAADATGPNLSYQQSLAVDLATTVGNVSALDNRSSRQQALVVSRTTAASISLLTNGALWGFPFTPGLPNEVIWFRDQEICLPPGAALRVGAQTVNQALFVTYMWRERALEDSELLAAK